MDFSVTITDDDFGLEAHVRFVGEDLLVAVWGGDRLISAPSLLLNRDPALGHHMMR